MTRSTFCSLISLSAPTAAVAKRSSALAGWAAVAAAAGAFVSATSYMRVPSLFAGGIQAMVLSRSSAAARIGDTAAVAGLAWVARKRTH